MSHLEQVHITVTAGPTYDAIVEARQKRTQVLRFTFMADGSHVSVIDTVLSNASRAINSLSEGWELELTVEPGPGNWNEWTTLKGFYDSTTGTGHLVAQLR